MCRWCHVSDSATHIRRDQKRVPQEKEQARLPARMYLDFFYAVASSPMRRELDIVMLEQHAIPETVAELQSEQFG